MKLEALDIQKVKILLSRLKYEFDEVEMVAVVKQLKDGEELTPEVINFLLTKFQEVPLTGKEVAEFASLVMKFQN